MACKNGKCGRCSQCQKSILNNQSSIIPNPSCVPDCGVLQGCTDTLPTNCIIYSGTNLSCISAYTGYNLNSILTNINSQMCVSIGTSGICSVKVDANDTNCGFLSPKIQTNSLQKTINNIGGNESIQLEQKPWTWFPLTLNAPFANASSIFVPLNGQRLSLLTTDAAFGVRCSGNSCNYDDVRFRGFIAGGSLASRDGVLLTTIPLVAAPDTTKVFSYSYYDNNSGAFTTVQITIDTSGNIRLIFYGNLLSRIKGNLLFDATFSLDGMSYAK